MPNHMYVAALVGPNPREAEVLFASDDPGLVQLVRGWMTDAIRADASPGETPAEGSAPPRKPPLQPVQGGAP